jgi:1,4-alpha-glucan branching enzyme
MSKKKETKEGLSKKQNRKATFTFMAPEAQSVLLAGDFNSWDPKTHPLKKFSDDMWKVNLNLSPGRYEYRFLVDGQWLNDPNCTTFVSNDYGSENCVLTLK